jgi:hypothetical protein
MSLKGYAKGVVRSVVPGAGIVDAAMNQKAQPAQYGQPIPEDIQGLRKQQIDFLTNILGSGGKGLEGFFGQIGSSPTGLQRQATGGISQFLSQPAPEQRAMDISLPALQNILNGKPGQGVIDALQPTFERNLASANQQGGRFGSSNAILRSRALEDFNLLGAQAAQQGQQSQLQAAQVLSLLANSAGQNPFQRLQGAYGIGQADAQQADLETQRRLQIMMALLGSAQGAAFNIPFVQQTPYQPPFWQQLLGAAAPIAGAAAGAG